MYRIKSKIIPSPRNQENLILKVKDSQHMPTLRCIQCLNYLFVNISCYWYASKMKVNTVEKKKNRLQIPADKQHLYNGNVRVGKYNT